MSRAETRRQKNRFSYSPRGYPGHTNGVETSGGAFFPPTSSREGHTEAVTHREAAPGVANSYCESSNSRPRLPTLQVGWVTARWGRHPPLPAPPGSHIDQTEEKASGRLGNGHLRSDEMQCLISSMDDYTKKTGQRDGLPKLSAWGSPTNDTQTRTHTHKHKHCFLTLASVTGRYPSRGRTPGLNV